MTQHSETGDLAETRRSVRGIVTAALADDMPTAAGIVQGLIACPTTAGDALMCLGEVAEMLLRHLAVAKEVSAEAAWQPICATMAKFDDSPGLPL